MRAKTLNEYGNWDLPAGAGEDPRAPYNQKDDNYELEIRDGHFLLHNNEDLFQFDPADVDALISGLLNLDAKQREDDGESFELLDVQNNGTHATVKTDHGEVDIVYSDLMDISYSSDY